MNVERLHLVLKATLDALTNSGVVADIGGLTTSLQNQVSDPATAAYQQQISTQLEKLRASLSAIETNNFPLGWKQVLTEHKLSHFIGTELLQALVEIFSRNAITPSIALKEIQDIQRELTADITATTELLNGFKRLEFPMDDLKPGEAEIGLLIPRESIDSRLDRFTRELNDTAKIIGVFEELTTGQRRDATIRTLSSTDLTVLLDIWPVSGAALAAAIERIASFYKQVLEIKKLKAEVARLALPDKMTQQLDQQANEKMETNLRLLRDEMIANYEGQKARKHELETELLIALHRIANKLDQGIHFEFRAGEPTTAASEDETSEQKALRSHTILINDIGRRMALIEPVEGRILHLPVYENGDEISSSKEEDSGASGRSVLAELGPAGPLAKASNLPQDRS
jgi:hypothetical protein